jgi:putative lipoprotein
VTQPATARLRAVAAALGALAAAGPAAAQIACPTDLSVEQRASVPSGEWTVATTGHRPLLAGVTIYAGPPERHVPVKSTREQTAKDETTRVWELPPGPDTYWLSCEYTHTNLVISRPLPKDIRRCETVEPRAAAPGDARPPVRRVACRGDAATRSREGAVIHRGMVVMGAREQVFTPCGAKTRYWVIDETPGTDLENLYRKLAPQGQALFVDVHGWIGPANEAAVAAKLDQAITVGEVRRALPDAASCNEDVSRFELRATGAEPAWTLEVGRDAIRFRREGADEQIFPYAKPQPASGGLLYAAKFEGPPARAIGVLVKRERCFDLRSGGAYSLSAEIGIGGEKLKGCAYAGEAARLAASARGASAAPASPTPAAAAAPAANTAPVKKAASAKAPKNRSKSGSAPR